jgi:hypothetical protein
MAQAESSERDLYGCGEFKYQEDAQKVYDRHPGDPYGLDGPIGPASEGIPGVACEDLPHRQSSGGRPILPQDTRKQPQRRRAQYHRQEDAQHGRSPLTSPRVICCSWEWPWWRGVLKR